MDKLSYFLAGCQAQLYKKRAWVVSAFSLTQEPPEAWHDNPYPYRLVSNPAGCFYVDPSNVTQLLPLQGSVPGQALLSFKDRITLQPGDLPNVTAPTETNLGNVLVNCLLLVYAFGAKVPFMTGKISVGRIEKLLQGKLKATPEDPAQRQDSEFYIDEYTRLAEALDHLAGLSQLCTWGASEKTLMTPPGIAEYKAQLLAQYKDQLNNPATIARISAALVQYRKDFLKGDEAAENFLISAKSHDVIGAKKYGMVGGEAGLDDDTTSIVNITRSLGEGWDLNAFPAMMDSLRAKSFNRGAETELGGVAVKWLLRASSNLRVVDQDCGAKVGEPILVTPDNQARFVGLNLVGKDAPVLIENEAQMGAYLGRKVMMRSPMFCKLPLTDYCRVCVGERLAANPHGLSAAVSEYGSTFLYIFMGAAHSASLKLAKMDFTKAIA